ncbi:NifQ [compost metagenome]
MSGREDVSGLLRVLFEPVFLGNTTDMKWKKFFYHRVCERLDLHPCPEPSCSGCDQFANCHGAEARLDQAQAVSVLPSAKRT